MALTQALQQGLWSPLQGVGNELLRTVPNFLGAILLLILGYVIAILVSRAVYKLVEKADLQTWLVEKTKVKNLFGKLDLAELLGMLTKWYVFILFLPAIAGVFSLGDFGSLLRTVAEWIPNLIVGAIVALVGYAAAEFVNAQIKATKAKGAVLVGQVVKIIIWVFTLLMALRQLGVEVALAEATVLLLFQGVVFAFALALGIGFGLALKDEAKTQLKNLKKLY